MREDLLCEVRGRLISRLGKPQAGKWVEFLPSRPFFVLDGVTLCPIGARTTTDEDGRFTVMLTRSDLSGIGYLTRGALGCFIVALNGPGPHIASELLKGGKKLAPMARDS